MGAGKAHVRETLMETRYYKSLKDVVVVDADVFKHGPDKIHSRHRTATAMDDASSVLHKESVDQSQAHLATLIANRRNVIFDGTHAWSPYVTQTLAIIRDNEWTYAPGPGFQVWSNRSFGEVSENYWGLSTRAPSPMPAYRVVFIGVLCHPAVAVERARVRHHITGRGVPFKEQLLSHTMFSRSVLSLLLPLVDAMYIFENSVDGHPSRLIAFSPLRGARGGFWDASQSVAALDDGRTSRAVQARTARLLRRASPSRAAAALRGALRAHTHTVPSPPIDAASAGQATRADSASAASAARASSALPSHTRPPIHMARGDTTAGMYGPRTYLRVPWLRKTSVSAGPSHGAGGPLGPPTPPHTAHAATPGAPATLRKFMRAHLRPHSATDVCSGSPAVTAYRPAFGLHRQAFGASRRPQQDAPTGDAQDGGDDAGQWPRVDNEGEDDSSAGGDGAGGMTAIQGAGSRGGNANGNGPRRRHCDALTRLRRAAGAAAGTGETGGASITHTHSVGRQGHVYHASRDASLRSRLVGVVRSRRLVIDPGLVGPSDGAGLLPSPPSEEGAVVVPLPTSGGVVGIVAAAAGGERAPPVATSAGAAGSAVGDPCGGGGEGLAAVSVAAVCETIAAALQPGGGGGGGASGSPTGAVAVPVGALSTTICRPPVPPCDPSGAAARPVAALSPVDQRALPPRGAPCGRGDALLVADPRWSVLDRLDFYSRVNATESVRRPRLQVRLNARLDARLPEAPYHSCILAADDALAEPRDDVLSVNGTWAHALSSPVGRLETVVSFSYHGGTVAVWRALRRCRAVWESCDAVGCGGQHPAARQPPRVDDCAGNPVATSCADAGPPAAAHGLLAHPLLGIHPYGASQGRIPSGPMRGATRGREAAFAAPLPTAAPSPEAMATARARCLATVRSAAEHFNPFDAHADAVPHEDDRGSTRPVLRFATTSEEVFDATAVVGLPFKLPQLPRTNAQFRSSGLFAGPTPRSNWIVPDRVCVGASPSVASNRALQHTFLEDLIVRARITTFCCLQTTAEQLQAATSTTSHPTAIEDPFVVAPSEDPISAPSHNATREIAADATPHGADTDPRAAGLRARSKTSSDPLEPVGSYYQQHAYAIGRTAGVEVNFVQLPVHDMGIGPPEQVLYLCHYLVSLLAAGERIYIHCAGGHGRSGVVASVLVGILYGLDAAAAMRVVQWAHDCREDVTYPLSPQTINQRNQVHRIIEFRHIMRPPARFAFVAPSEQVHRWAGSTGLVESIG